jgi:hypothetical protein
MGVGRLVARLTWRALDQLESHEPAAKLRIMRTALQQTSDEGRQEAANTVREWYKAKPIAQRPELWKVVGCPFFDHVWARRIAPQ